jgi:hypothetical protein
MVPLTCALTSVTLTATGVGTYAYSGGSATVSTPGTYTVTVTATNGCTATATTAITQNITAPTAGLTNNGPLTCALTSVTLTATGAGTYAYSGGSATVSTPGTYTVTVTGANGCIATATTAVTSNTTTTAPTLSIVNNTCPTTTGTISATGNVGDVIWYYTGVDALTASANAASNTGGSTTAPTYSAFPTVVYVCAVAQSTNGCYSSATCGQTAPTYCTICGATAAAPTGTITSPICQQGGALTGSTATDATPLLTDYSRWYLLVDNATSIIVDHQLTVAALTAPANTSNADKTYSVYSLVYSSAAPFGTVNITNGTTNIILGDADVIDDNDGDPLLAAPTDDSCMDLSPAAATTVTVNKAIVFEYSAFRICGNTTADVDLYSNVVGLQATWTASSSNGVTGFAQQPTAVTINPQNSFDITEVLSNTTASTGTVVYVVTPQLGTCFGDPVSITREVAPNLNLAITSTTCNAPTYDVAFSVAGGTPGYAVYTLVGTLNYTPSNATGSVTGIASGTPIDITLEDSEGCTALASTVVTIPSAPLITVTNSVCTTGCAPSGGSFDITTACTTGTLTYYTDAMGAGATTTAPTYNQTGPAQTIYYACVDLSGCASAIQTSATTVPGTCTPVTAGITAPVTELTCTTTSATLTATGGVSYAWDDSSTNAARTVTAAGTYTVTVTGANGCTATATVTVTQNITAPTAGITAPVTELTCTTTSVTLTATGVGTYNWDDNSTAAARTVTAAGTYTVTVTNTANGCTATATVTVTQNITAPTAGITAPVTELTCLTTSVTLTATGVGTYTWDDSSTAAARTVSAAGTYTVTVTGANGCTATATVIVTQNIAITAGITAPVTEGCSPNCRLGSLFMCFFFVAFN